MGLWNIILNCTATQLSRGFLIFHWEMWRERKKLSFTVSNGAPKIFLIFRLELLSPYNEHVCKCVLRVRVWCVCVCGVRLSMRFSSAQKANTSISRFDANLAISIWAEHSFIQLSSAFIVIVAFFSEISVIVAVVVWTYMFRLIDRTSLPINIKTIERCCSISNFGW